jgi:hypothetical protein
MCSGAELALDLAALRLDADASQRRSDEVHALRVTLVEAVAQVLDRGGQREGDGTLVRRNRPAA